MKLLDKIAELAETPGVVSTRITCRDGVLELEVFFAPETGRMLARYELDLGVAVLNGEEFVVAVLAGLASPRALQQAKTRDELLEEAQRVLMQRTKGDNDK